MKISINWVVAALVLGTLGCTDSPEAASSRGQNQSDLDAATAQYQADREPEGAVAVGEARERTEDGQEITLVGVIGGSRKPFVDGLAAFTIVDPKVPCCAPEEGCPTPWDYCCTQPQVKDNIATVKIVDDAGQPVARDARDFLNIKELSTVVVQGEARRDDQGNLTVAAGKVFVRPGE